MLREESEQGSVFEKTNPNLSFKRRYKKILSDSNCGRSVLRSQNMFDMRDEQNRMMVASQNNPEERPLGGMFRFQ